MSKNRALVLVICGILMVAITGCSSQAGNAKGSGEKANSSNSQSSKLPDSIPTDDNNKIKPEELGSIKAGPGGSDSSKANAPALIVEPAKSVTSLAAVPKSLRTAISEAAQKKQLKVVDLELVGGRLRVVLPEGTTAQQLEELAQTIGKNSEVKLAEPEIRVTHQKQ